MIVKFDSAFNRDIKKIKDQAVKDLIADAIEALENAGSLGEVKEVAPMKGHKGFYRYKTPPFRIGILKVDEETIILMRFMHRKDIYRYFPK